MKKILWKRFSEQKKCVRRRNKASAARFLMSINSREKSCSFSADGALIVSLYRAVDFFVFHAFLSSLKIPWQKSRRKQSGLPADIYVLHMYPESRQSDPHWLKKWRRSNNQALCSTQVAAENSGAYRKDEKYLRWYEVTEDVFLL